MQTFQFNVQDSSGQTVRTFTKTCTQAEANAVIDKFYDDTYWVAGIEVHEVNETDDNWVPGCGGTEVPFTYSGVRYLYVWQPSTGKHGWLNMDTDIVQEESPCQ